MDDKTQAYLSNPNHSFLDTSFLTDFDRATRAYNYLLMELNEKGGWLPRWVDSRTVLPSQGRYNMTDSLHTELLNRFRNLHGREYSVSWLPGQRFCTYWCAKVDHHNGDLYDTSGGTIRLSPQIIKELADSLTSAIEDQIIGEMEQKEWLERKKKAQIILRGRLYPEQNSCISGENKT